MRPSLRLRKGQKPGTPSRWKSRLVDIAILAAAAIVCLFVFSFSTRLSYSRPEIHEAPEIIRVQVLNGSGKAGMARKVADHLTMLAVGRMRFDAIDVGNFDRADIKRTFIINRRLTRRSRPAPSSGSSANPPSASAMWRWPRRRAMRFSSAASADPTRGRWGFTS